MCWQLREIYDKKSPVFLIEIYVLAATVIILTTYPPAACHSSLSGFHRLAIIVSAAEIFCKTIVLAVVHAINRERSKLMQNIFVGVFVVGHIALWGYSVALYGSEEMQRCKTEEPHFFYIKMYAYLYGILLIGSLMLLIVLLFPAAVITIFSFKKSQREDSDDNE